MERLYPWIWDAVIFGYVLSGGILFDVRIALSEQVSLNQILGAITFARLAWRLSSIRHVGIKGRTTTSIVVLLTLVLAVRSLGTPNKSYAFFKVVSYATLVLPVLLHLELHVRTRADIIRFLWISALSTMALVVLSLPEMRTMQGGQRLAVLGGGPNVFARHLGTGMFGAFVLLKMRGQRDWKAFVVCAGLLLAGFALLLTGTKSVLLSLALATLFMYWRLGRRRIVVVIAGTMAVAMLLPLATHGLVQSYQKDGGLVRLLTFPDLNDPLGSYGSRARYLAGTWQELTARPWLGVGTGAWGIHLGPGFEDAYPHNILLEIVGELGFLGLTLVFLPLAWPVVRKFKTDSILAGTTRANVLAIGLAGMALFWGVNVQLSGDLVDSRFLWFWLAVLERDWRERLSSF
jgi:O-antigen ligase